MKMAYEILWAAIADNNLDSLKLKMWGNSRTKRVYVWIHYEYFKNIDEGSIRETFS
jgi:hypothetical protein